MSLTSYRTAPPRAMAWLRDRELRLSLRQVRAHMERGAMQAAVRFDDLAATYSPTP